MDNACNVFSFLFWGLPKLITWDWPKISSKWSLNSNASFQNPDKIRREIQLWTLILEQIWWECGLIRGIGYFVHHYLTWIQPFNNLKFKWIVIRSTSMYGNIQLHIKSWYFIHVNWKFPLRTFLSSELTSWEAISMLSTSQCCSYWYSKVFNFYIEKIF